MRVNRAMVCSKQSACSTPQQSMLYSSLRSCETLRETENPSLFDAFVEIPGIIQIHMRCQVLMLLTHVSGSHSQQLGGAGVLIALIGGSFSVIHFGVFQGASISFTVLPLRRVHHFAAWPWRSRILVWLGICCSSVATA